MPILKSRSVLSSHGRHLVRPRRWASMVDRRHSTIRDPRGPCAPLAPRCKSELCGAIRKAHAQTVNLYAPLPLPSPSGRPACGKHCPQVTQVMHTGRCGPRRAACRSDYFTHHVCRTRAFKSVIIPTSCIDFYRTEDPRVRTGSESPRAAHGLHTQTP